MDDGAEGHPVPPGRGHVGHLEQTVHNLITLRHSIASMTTLNFWRHRKERVTVNVYMTDIELTFSLNYM